jgi:hypothetical protein
MRPHEGSPYPTRRLPGDPSTGRSPSRAPSVLSPRLHEAHLTPASSDSRSTPLPRACGPPRHGLPLSQTNLGLAELPNDLLLCELPPSWHCRPPSVATTRGFVLRMWPDLRMAGQDCDTDALPPPNRAHRLRALAEGVLHSFTSSGRPECFECLRKSSERQAEYVRLASPRKGYGVCVAGGFPSSNSSPG